MKFFQMYKKELFSFLFCFLLFFFVSFFSISFLTHQYQQSFLTHQANFIHDLVLQHPELEYEIMHIYKHPSQNNSMDLFSKYGYTDREQFSYLDYVSEINHITTQCLFFSFFLCFFVFFLLVLFFYYQKFKRIQDIHEYLFRVLRNDYRVNLKDYREDSISMLKNDLMKVTNKLRNVSEVSLEDKKNLEQTLSDISHQLRTPLTSMYVINDVLSSGNVKKEDAKKFLIQQREQLERMEWLIVALLKMSQIDSGTIIFQQKEEFMKHIVKEALKPSLIPLELKQIHYQVNISDDLFCVCDFHWTVEALINLIKNAMEHTEVAGHIIIEAKDTPLYVEFSIQDDGVGIPKKDIPHIFERFYKGNTKNDSIGIGLNLSKTIIEKQNGTIHVYSEEGKGTKFVIHFYKVTI